MLEVKNKKILLKLRNHKEGECVKVLDEDKIYQYLDGCWKEYEAPKFSMSLYDINKSVYLKKDNLDDFGISEGKALIRSYVKKTKAKYYMLLNNELKYYTVFAIDDEGSNKIDLEVISTLKEFDNIKDIKEDNDSIEIWATLNGELGYFLFFDYDKGVIKCK